MKITDLLAITEAKFRKPYIMYHGTSTKFLHSILKNGIRPDPKEKTWADDEQQVQTSFSRKSLQGSYWTSNLLTATGAAANTATKFGGNQLLIIAQIAEQSAYADEDMITHEIHSALSYTMEELHPNIRHDFYMALGHDLYDQKDTSKVQSFFRNKLHELLGGSSKHTPNKELFNNLLDTLVKRSMAYEYKNGMNRNSWVSNVPELPSITELDNAINDLREQLTRSYRSNAMKRKQFSHNLRTTLPVGFSGANKILNIIEIPPLRWGDDERDSKSPDWQGSRKVFVDPLILQYGSKNLPQSFLSEYKRKKGKFPGLSMPNGEVIIPSQRD